MKEKVINEILKAMSHHLSGLQLSQLTETLTHVFENLEIEVTNNTLVTDIQTSEKLVQMYLVCQKINGIADSTITAYKFTIKKFMEFVDFKAWDKIDTNTVRLYLYQCEKRGNSKTTIDNIRRNLSAFCQWLEDEGYIQKNPCKKISRIKEPSRLKRFFSEYEVEMLRDSCKTKKEMALVDLLISSGLRIGEIPTIKVSEIDWNEGKFHVIGKGNKERVGYLTVRAKKHLREYILERETHGITSDYLFCRSKAPYDVPIGKQAINKTLKQIGDRCNLPDIHVHGLRAYFATNLSKHGVSADIIQLLMGHESYSTTVRYYCAPNMDLARKAVLSCA